MSANVDPNPAPPPAPPADPPATPPPGDKGAIPFERFDEVNKRMKAAEAKLAAAEADRAKSDEERLAADKKFEDLATKRATERDEWKGKAEAAETRASTLETRLHAIADERIKELPEKLRERVPAADKAGALDRVEKIEELLAVLAEVPTAPPGPGIGRGPKPAGGPPNAKQVVDEAVERALRSGGYGF